MRLPLTICNNHFRRIFSVEHEEFAHHNDKGSIVFEIVKKGRSLVKWKENVVGFLNPILPRPFCEAFSNTRESKYSFRP